MYRNIPRAPRCRAAGTWSPRCEAAGAFVKNFCENICAQVPGGRSPGSGAASPPRPPGSPTLI